MPIQTRCPSCSARVSAKDSAAGQRLRCPRCGASVPLPAASATTMQQPAVVPPMSLTVPPQAPPVQVVVHATAGPHCPHCGYEGPPEEYQRTQLAGYVIAAVWLVMCLMLGPIGIICAPTALFWLLVREPHRVCYKCKGPL